MSEEDLFLREKLAGAFCDQYDYKDGTTEREIALNAFIVGFELGKN